MKKKRNYLVDLLSIGCPEKIKELQEAHASFQENIVSAVKQKAELDNYISQKSKEESLKKAK